MQLAGVQTKSKMKFAVNLAFPFPPVVSPPRCVWPPCAAKPRVAASFSRRCCCSDLQNNGSIIQIGSSGRSFSRSSHTRGTGRSDLSCSSSSSNGRSRRGIITSNGNPSDGSHTSGPPPTAPRLFNSSRDTDGVFGSCRTSPRVSALGYNCTSCSSCRSPSSSGSRIVVERSSSHRGSKSFCCSSRPYTRVSDYSSQSSSRGSCFGVSSSAGSSRSGNSTGFSSSTPLERRSKRCGSSTRSSLRSSRVLGQSRKSLDSSSSSSGCSLGRRIGSSSTRDSRNSSTLGRRTLFSSSRSCNSSSHFRSSSDLDTSSGRLSDSSGRLSSSSSRVSSSSSHTGSSSSHTGSRGSHASDSSSHTGGSSSHTGGSNSSHTGSSSSSSHAGSSSSSHTGSSSSGIRFGGSNRLGSSSNRSRCGVMCSSRAVGGVWGQRGFGFWNVVEERRRATAAAAQQQRQASARKAFFDGMHSTEQHRQRQRRFDEEKQQQQRWQQTWEDRSSRGSSRSSSSPNYYRVLGIQRTATLAEIKKAYVALVKSYHPDQNPSEQQKAAEKLQEVQQAYAVLKDPTSRSRHDEQLDREEAGLSYSIPWEPEFETEEEREARRERYRRYAAGIRNDLRPSGTFPPGVMLGVASAAIFGVARYFSLKVKENPDAGDSLDDAFVDGDFRGEPLVRAFFNPFSATWERLPDGFDPPLPLTLLKHYRRQYPDMYFDSAALPRNQLTVVKVPKSQTQPAKLLLEKRTGAIVWHAQLRRRAAPSPSLGAPEGIFAATSAGAGMAAAPAAAAREDPPPPAVVHATPASAAAVSAARAPVAAAPASAGGAPASAAAPASVAAGACASAAGGVSPAAVASGVVVAEAGKFPSGTPANPQAAVPSPSSTLKEAARPAAGGSSVSPSRCAGGEVLSEPPTTAGFSKT